MQHGALVLAQGQAHQAAGGRAQGTVGLIGPVRGEHQAFVAGQDEQLQGRLAAVDGNHLAVERAQTRQRCAVQAQNTVEAVFDAGEQAGQEHQGLIPRCRATMPLVMLW
ncbi:hypothetical protein D3C81_2051240 [compost metagenome]